MTFTLYLLKTNLKLEFIQNHRNYEFQSYYCFVSIIWTYSIYNSILGCFRSTSSRLTGAQGHARIVRFREPRCVTGLQHLIQSHHLIISWLLFCLQAHKKYTWGKMTLVLDHKHIPSWACRINHCGFVLAWLLELLYVVAVFLTDVLFYDTLWGENNNLRTRNSYQFS